MGVMHGFAGIPDIGSLTFGDWMFVVANIIIPLGYIFIAIKVMPILPVSGLTKFGARAFFILCAATHVDQTIHTLWYPLETYRQTADDFHMLLIHIPQAVAIWIFAIGFFTDLKRLSAERHGSHRSTGDSDAGRQ